MVALEIALLVLGLIIVSIGVASGDSVVLIIVGSVLSGSALVLQEIRHRQKIRRRKQSSL